jgi:hypothetical protein
MPSIPPGRFWATVPPMVLTEPEMGEAWAARSPCGAKAAARACQVAPAPTTAVRFAASMRMPFIRTVSTTTAGALGTTPAV